MRPFYSKDPFSCGVSWLEITSLFGPSKAGLELGTVRVKVSEERRSGGQI